MLTRIKIVIILLVIVLLSISGCNKKQEEVRSFASHYKAFQDSYKDRMILAKSTEEQSEIQKEKIKNLSELLEKYGKISDSDYSDLLKAKILVEISQFNEAEKLIEKLIAKNSSFSLDAKMLNVHIRILNGEKEKALRLFKEIEPSLKEENDRLMGWLYLSLYSSDSKEKVEYSRKLLATEHLPHWFSEYKAEVYWNLAAQAREKRDFSKAKEMLENAISATTEEQNKPAFESALKQLDLIGRPAQEIIVDNWFNSPPISWKSLEGKVLVINFWAPWSDACRNLLPVLDVQFQKYKDNGLIIFGNTKLYGSFNDETTQKESLSDSEEIEFLRQYIEKNSIHFPIGLSYEGYGFEDYHVSGLPTLVFIDKNGEVDDIIMGVRQPQLIENKIKKLMEDTNGKN